MKLFASCGRKVLSGLALVAALAGSQLIALAAAGPHHVAAGMLDVDQISPLDTNNNALATLALGINTFQLGTYNRADYNLRIGIGGASAQDEFLGILMTSVTQNGRDNFGTNGYPASAIATNGSGAYRIVSWLGTDRGAGNGIEYNVDVAGAWFPYDHFLGGFARNAAGSNTGTNNLFTGSPGLVLGTHFRGVATGRSIVDLRTLGIDSRTDGVLLVNHAKDEDNYALSQVNGSDGTWNVFVRDIGQPAVTTYEQDPVAFVFIPKTNTALVSGRFRADGAIEIYSGASPQFTVTTLGTGQWELRVMGHSPTNGVLIISPEGGGAVNGDNIVSYQINAARDGWEIQSRDTPSNGLQTPTGEPVASFVFIPAIPPGITVTPTNDLVTTGSGGSGTFTVVLDAPPAAEVSIDVTSNDPSKGVAAPGMLTFGMSDWFVPQVVTVTGQAAAAEGGYGIILSPTTSADPRYQGMDPPDVTASSLASRAFVIWPANQAIQVTTSPVLKVAVTNGVAGNLTVRFFGREAPTLFPGPDFAIAIMPDTQLYTAERYGGTVDMFIAQTEWIITNRVSRNIAYATQLGDIVNDGDLYNGLPNLDQWLNATNAMYRLENPARTQLPDGISYGVAVGNHEMEPIGDPTGTTLFYNQYFGVPHFTGRQYYAGHYGTNNNNHFDFFSAGGLDFVVLYFEFDDSANPAVLAWGNEVLRTNAHRRAIVVTHNFGNTQTPVAFSPQGAAIYRALKGNTNLFLMLGGHVTGQGAREDTYNGNTVRTFVQDYQGWINGGNGFMRTMEFSPSNNIVVVETFSPVTGEYLTDPDSEFFFPYNMQPAGPGAPTPFVALGTNFGVAPGNLASCSWSGLQPNKAYEWYVAVADQWGVTVAGSVWRFTTALTNTPPSISNLARTIVGDAPTNLTLVASDMNGDPITFQTPTAPDHGLLQNLDSAAGTVTYWPVHGYRGFDRFVFSANDGQSTRSATMNITIVAPTDANANGLPDVWETAYGITVPGADADGDGESNLDEFFANTNPTNAASVLRFTEITRHPNGHVDLTWASVGGSRYRVQFSNGATNGGIAGTFLDLVRPLAEEMDASAPGAPSTQIFTDDFTLSGTPTNKARYYRLKVAP